MPFAEAMCNLTTACALFARSEPENAKQHLARTREIGSSMDSRYIEYLYLLAAAKAALDDGNEPKGLEPLREAMSLARRQGFWTHMWMPADTLARLCASALEHGIEVEYVRELIRRRRIHPDDASMVAESWPWPVRIMTLGQFEVVIHDKPLRFSSKVQKKPLALLKAIISLGGQEVREETLMDALWPEAEGDAAARALTSTLHRLRHLLGSDAVSRQDGQLGLDRRYCWVDVWALEECLSQAASVRRFNDRDRLLQRAASLYRGPFLPGGTDPWTATLRERLRAHLRVVETAGATA
jgi:hypothetical protein